MNQNILKKKLLNNEIIAFQTETVYGIFGIPTSENRKKINILKGRHENQQIQISFGNMPDLLEWIDVNDKQEETIKKNIKNSVSFLVKAKRSKIALLSGSTILVRMPTLEKDSTLAILLNEIGPMFSSSANIHGTKPLNDCKHITRILGIECHEGNGGVNEFENKDSKIISLLDDKEEIIRN